MRKTKLTAQTFEPFNPLLHPSPADAGSTLQY